MLQIIRLLEILFSVSLIRFVSAQQLEFPQLLSALNTLHPVTPEHCLCYTTWCATLFDVKKQTTEPDLNLRKCERRGGGQKLK